MKIFHAVTTVPLTLKRWDNDAPHAFPAGTAVTAIVWSPERCHLNAEFEGEFYAGYAPAGELQLGDVAATVNEG
jgi:hypothetical protein